MRSPYWKEKMKQFDITSDSDNYKIIFQNDPDDENRKHFMKNMDTNLMNNPVKLKKKVCWRFLLWSIIFG